MLNLSPRSKKRTYNFALPALRTMPDISSYLTTQQAAKKLGFSIRAVNRLVANKKLDGIRVGRMHLISKESIATYLSFTKGMSKNDPRRKTTSNE